MPEEIVFDPFNDSGKWATLIRSRGIGQILKESVALYRTEWWVFTRPLLLPVLLKIVGMILAVLLPLFIFNTFTDWVFTLRVPVRLFTFFILPFPGIALMCRGFWLYMVYMTSFNINLMECLQGGAPDFEKAFRRVPVKAYSQVLLVLLAIWVPAIIAYSVGLSGSALSGDNWVAVVGFLLTFGFLSLVLVLAATVFAVYFSLAFQVFSLEPTLQGSGMAVVKRSFQLVKNNFWRTLLLLTIMAITTGMVIPFVVTLILDLLHLTHLLRPPALYFIHTMLNSIPTGTIHQLETFGVDVYDEAPLLALDVVHLFTNTAITLLLLPLGTFVQGLLYLDIRAQKVDNS